jgi:hypothetical protein
MARVRISTTVDQDRLARCRRLVGTSDSKLVDSALSALLDKLEAAHEQEILAALPYEADPDLSWVAPPGPDLPYLGEVPDDVMRTAEARREATR